jgi:hypothetical protein
VRTPRILAVLAALCLVGAVALATSGPRAMTLAGALGGDGVVGLERVIGGTFGMWAWSKCVFPFLGRPAWLPPFFMGVVLAGLALTISYRARAREGARGRRS